MRWGKREDDRAGWDLDVVLPEQGGNLGELAHFGKSAARRLRRGCGALVHEYHGSWSVGLLDDAGAEHGRERVGSHERSLGGQKELQRRS